MTDHYALIAAELRRMADDLDTLTGTDLPAPYVHVDIHPGGPTSERAGDERVITAVDTVALALLGTPGATYPLPSGSYHHGVNTGRRGGIHIAVYDSVSDPAIRERDAELARLRAELARATA